MTGESLMLAAAMTAILCVGGAVLFWWAEFIGEKRWPYWVSFPVAFAPILFGLFLVLAVVVENDSQMQNTESRDE